MSVRFIVHKMVDAEVNYVEASGLSTDLKPTSGICTGSSFFEVDTGKVSFYDEDNVIWYDKKKWAERAAETGITETEGENDG